MKHIIIFGGAGFIGTNLTKRLLSDGHKIICVDNLFTGRQTNINNFMLNKNYTCLTGDITNEDTFIRLNNVIEDFFYNCVDEIYNLACPASPPKYQIDPIYTIHVSLAVERICKLAMEYNAKMMHSSTSEVYGEPNVHPQVEKYRGNVNTMGPRSCYDEGKRIAETIVYEYAKLGCKAKIIRIFNTYGPYMDPNDGRAISNFICQAMLNRNITIYGDGTQTRSFQYIDDLIEGMLAMMNTEEEYIGPVNIGNPQEINMNDLVNLILKKIPLSKSKIIYEDLPQDDPTKRCANIHKLNYKTGWKPVVNIEEGLKRTIIYFQNELQNTFFIS